LGGKVAVKGGTGCFTRGMILSPSLLSSTIEGLIRSDGRVEVVARARRVQGRCPPSGATSSAPHNRYDRRPADLPSIGRPKALHLRARRFNRHQEEVGDEHCQGRPG